MNKKSALLLVALASLVAGCGGGGGSSGTTNPGQINFQHISFPSGFTSLGDTGLGIDTTTNQIAVPGACGYRIWTVGADFIQDLETSIKSGDTGVAVKLIGSGTVIATLTHVYWVEPENAQALVVESDGCTSTSAFTVTPYVVTQDTAMVSKVRALLNDKTNGYNLVTFNSVTKTLYFSNIAEQEVWQIANEAGAAVSGIPEQCGIAGGTSENLITLVEAGNFNHTAFLTTGSSGGDVCVRNGDDGPWTVLSNQAPTGRSAAVSNYHQSTIFNYAFHDNGDNTYFGFWALKGSNSGDFNLYRISGLVNNDQYIGQAFWNAASSNGADTNNVVQHNTSNTSTITVTGSPDLTAGYTTCITPGGTLIAALGDNSGPSTNTIKAYALVKDQSPGKLAWSNVNTTYLNGSSGGYTFSDSGGDGCLITSSNGQVVYVTVKQ